MSSTSPTGESFSASDRDIVSLYLKYPDLEFQFDDDEPYHGASEEQSETFSSPATSSTTQILGSSTQTTPLRPDASNTAPQTRDEYQDLIALLLRSDLSNDGGAHFTNLANSMLRISTLLFSHNDLNFDGDNGSEILHTCEDLITVLCVSRGRVDEQITNVAYVQTLAPFNVRPGTEFLTANLRQKAELVIRHTAAPSQTEVNILESLARIYDAYVYNPALVALRRGQMDANMQSRLDAAYDATMTLLGQYKIWCRAMKRLKYTHIQPLLTAISLSSAARKEEREIGDMKVATGLAAADPNAPGLQPVDVETLEVMRANARRKNLRTSRVKTRFRREHTL